MIQRFDAASRRWRRVGVLLVSLLLTAVGASAQTVYWNTDSSGAWEDPNNWLPVGVPGAGANVVIDRPSANPTITIAGSTAAIATLVSYEPLVIAGTLQVGSSATFNANVTWSQGTLSGPGQFVVGSGATLTANTAAGRTLLSPLYNQGTVIMSDSGVSMGPVVITNGVGALWNCTNDLTFYAPGGGATFSNFGTLSKSGGAGQVTFTSVTVNNSALIDVQSGDLVVSSGINTGTLNAGPGVSMTLNNWTLNAGTTLAGSGGFVVSGTTQVATTLTSTRPVTVSGTLSVAYGEVFTFGANSSWPQGTLAGPGQFVVANGVTLTASTAAGRTLSAPLTNHGAVVQNAASITMGTVTITNAVDGTWTLAGDLGFYAPNGGAAFNNAGLLQKTAGAGAAGFTYVTVSNSGTFDVQTGDMLQAAATNSGTLNVGPSVSMSLNNWTLNAGTVLTGTGGFAVTGTTTVTATMTFARPVTVSGQLTANQGVVVTFGVSSGWTSGSLAGPGQFAVPSGVTLTISTASAHYLSGALTNHGSVVQSAASLTLDPVTITNAGDANWTLAADVGFYAPNGGGVFTNAGLLQKTTGTGASAFTYVTLTNTGTVDVQTGDMLQTAATNSGTLNVGPSVSMSLNNWTLNAGTVLTGTGGFAVTGTTTVTATMTFARPVTVSGQLTANQGVVVTFGVSSGWTSGILAGPGQFVVPSGVTLTISSASAHYLYGALTNHGSVVQSGASLTLDPVTITNAGDGTWTLAADVGFYAPNGGGVFTNVGTLQKTTGTGASTFTYVTLTNTGTVDVQTGDMPQTAATNSGTLNVGPSVSMTLSNWTLNAGTVLTGTGGFAVTGATTVAATMTFARPVSVSGQLTANQGAVVTFGVSSAWTSGILAGPGQFVVPSGVTLTISSASAHYLYGALTNHGSVVQSGASLTLDPVTITNAGDGTWTLAADVGLYAPNGGGVFTNAGLLQKTTGTGASAFTYVTLTNTGIIALRLGAGVADSISATTLTIGGTLAITYLPGFQPTDGQQFTVVTGPRTGTFATVTSPTPLVASYTATSVVLTRSDALSLTSVLPAAGPLSGGTAITLVGANFSAGATVTVGTTPATSVVVVSPTLITAITPSSTSVGAKAVTVTKGLASATRPGAFTYTTAQSLSEEFLAGDGSVATAGTRQPVFSATGRYLAFVAMSDLTSDDHNGLPDILVRDRQTGTLVRLSRSYTGGDPDGASSRPRISADGRYVAFRSEATNLVPGDTNGVADVFWVDRDVDADGVFDEAGQTQTLRVSVSDTGAQGTLASGGADELDLSPDGLWVAYASIATTLVPGDTNNAADVFLHHVTSGRTTRVSVATGGVQVAGASGRPRLTNGARFVIFASDATTLVTGDHNGARDIFLHERATGTTMRLSQRADGAEADGPSDWPAIDDVGLTYAYQTRATNLLPALAGSTRWQVVAFSLLFTPQLQNGVMMSARKTNPSLIDIAGSTGQVISGRPLDGTAGNGDSTGAEVSDDGGAVGAVTAASDTLEGDANGQPDALTRAIDETTGQLGAAENRSRDDAGNQALAPTDAVALDGDGSDVGLETAARLTATARAVLGDSTAAQVYAQGTPLRVDLAAPRVARTDQGDRVAIVGAGFAADVQVRLGTAPQAVVFERSTSLRINATASNGQTGVVDLVAMNPGTGETVTIRGGFTFVAPPAPGSLADTDADGLPDVFETQYGLDPKSPVGNDGPDGDPDGDGVTNLQEYQQGSHPRGTVTRFLAEGVVNAGVFVTRLALANPGPAPVRALVRAQLEGGGERQVPVTLDGYRSTKLTLPAALPGMPAVASFSTLVEADGPIVVDRRVTWDGVLNGLTFGYGTHGETAVKSPATAWYFAEGATHSGFALYYLLQNPSPTDTALVEATYLRANGTPITRAYTLDPASRVTIYANLVPGLSAADVAAVFRVTNGVPIVAERAMYLDTPGHTWAIGTDGAGVTSPGTDWFLAEGATGYFDMFVQIGNPSATAATVTVDFLLESGEVLRSTRVVPANSRDTIWVNYEEFDGVRRLAQAPTSVRLHADVPIIAERSMWWPAPFTTWQEAHASFASRQTGTAWALAEGAVTPAPTSTQTYILVANTSPYPARVRVSLLRPDAAPPAREVVVPATSRLTVAVADYFPELGGNGEFGALVESLVRTGAACTDRGAGLAPDCAPAQIVVEQAVYDNAHGIFWAGGTAQLATLVR